MISLGQNEVSSIIAEQDQSTSSASSAAASIHFAITLDPKGPLPGQQPLRILFTRSMKAPMLRHSTMARGIETVVNLSVQQGAMSHTGSPRPLCGDSQGIATSVKSLTTGTAPIVTDFDCVTYPVAKASSV